MHTPRYSIVIPAHNALQTLVPVLGLLRTQTMPSEEFECIVVDDGSTDGTNEFVRGLKKSYSLRLVTHASRQGRAAARNSGWRQSHGEIVVFLDADMIPDDDWLESYDEAFQQTQADIISGQHSSLSKPGHVQLGQHAHPLFAALETQTRDCTQTHPQNLFCAYAALASNLAIRRSWLDRVDGFNPFFARFEDIELGLRLWEANAKFAFAEANAVQMLEDDFDPAKQWFTAEELTALFLRHPYRAVLLAGFWGAQQIEGVSGTEMPSWASLSAILDSESHAPLHEIFKKHYQLPLPVECLYTIEAATEVHQTRNQCTPEVAREAINHVVARGIYAEEHQGNLMLDIHHTMNWIACSSPYRDADGMIAWCDRRRTPFQQSLIPEDAVSYQCSGRYEITIPGDLLRAHGGEAKLNIPLLMEHESQTTVQMTQCFPANLLDDADQRQGMVFRYRVRAGDEETVRIGYDFTCRVHEFVSREREHVAQIAPSDMAAFLRPTLPDAYLPLAHSILEAIIPDKTGSPYTMAQAIYHWAWDNFEFLELSLPYFYLLQTGFGACVQRMKLCLNLMRLAGIPAREQCGVLFERGAHRIEPQTLVQTTFGASPFIHTWVEFYTQERGWTPLIEFNSTVRIQSVAIADDEKRREIHASSQRLCSELFGSIDPYRLYGSDQGSRVPTYPLVKTKMGWQPQSDITRETLHVVRCVFS